MKSLRQLLIPAASFAIAWSLAYFLTRNPPPPVAPEIAPLRQAARVKASPAGPRKAAIQQLVIAFLTRPLAEWPTLWEAFASQATVADLETIPQLVNMPRRISERRDGSNVLQLLAKEELAVRTDLPLAPHPGAYAALAETDPAAAWRNLARYNRSDLAVAVARTLAKRDPVGTLQRLQAIPAPMKRPMGYETDVGEGGMNTDSPVAAVFAAWARRDPTAAAAAVMKLPPPERAENVWKVATTWAYRDGPAAIRFMVGFIESGDPDGDRDSRFDCLEPILRASFQSHPAETAAIISGNPKLRDAMAGRQCKERVLRRWQENDPAAALAWALEEETARKHSEKMDDTARWNSRGRYFFDAIKSDPAAIERYIRALAAIGSDSAEVYLRSISYREPTLARALADELGFKLPENPASKSLIIDEDPAAACDQWLAELRKVGDPDQALAALGWDKNTATQLAARAALVFPDKAAELAKLVPAASLDASVRSHDLGRFWPDLAPAPKTPESASTRTPAFQEDDFKLDPAAAAASVKIADLTDKEVAKVIDLWAPHDLPAARAWLSRVPAGPARQQGELAIAKIRAPYDPVAVLTSLTSRRLTTDRATRELWSICLRRIALNGGDWRSWLARMPADTEPPGAELADSLAAEARLLEVLKQERAR